LPGSISWRPGQVNAAVGPMLGNSNVGRFSPFFGEFVPTSLQIVL
jgi:hypothetical protein